MAGANLARPSSKAAEEARTIVFVDEAGFYPLPFVVRTYAPIGQTPVLRVPLCRDHCSVIGAVSSEARLLTRIQRDSFTGGTVVAFLGQLLRQVPGKLLVIWDGASIHHCRVVKGFLVAGAAARLHLARLPAYAPDLNPAEGVWNLLKRRELRNRCCQDLDELDWELRLAIRRLQRRPRLLTACVAQGGYREIRPPRLVLQS